MNNYSFLFTATSAPSAEDIAHYTRPDGSIDHAGQSAFEAGWYQAQAQSLTRTVKVLIDVLAEKDRQIERLNTRPIG